MPVEAASSPLQHSIRIRKTFLCKLSSIKESRFVPPVNSTRKQYYPYKILPAQRPGAQPRGRLRRTTLIKLTTPPKRIPTKTPNQSHVGCCALLGIRVFRVVSDENKLVLISVNLDPIEQGLNRSRGKVRFRCICRRPEMAGGQIEIVCGC